MTQSYLPSRWLITAPNLADDPDIFPLLPGFGFVTSKKPQWSTIVSQASSGRERRRMAWSYPLWTFNIGYEVLRDGPGERELQKLYAFFNAHAGKYQEFFFFDPSDNAVADQPFGIGDGVVRRIEEEEFLILAGMRIEEGVQLLQLALARPVAQDFVADIERPERIRPCHAPPLAARRGLADDRAPLRFLGRHEAEARE